MCNLYLVSYIVRLGIYNWILMIDVVKHSPLEYKKKFDYILSWRLLTKVKSKNQITKNIDNRNGFASSKSIQLSRKCDDLTVGRLFIGVINICSILSYVNVSYW